MIRTSLTDWFFYGNRNIKIIYIKKQIKIMKYNTELNKHILLPIEVKERLDEVIKMIITKRIEQGDKRLRVSYADAIKYLLDK